MYLDLMRKLLARSAGPLPNLTTSPTSQVRLSSSRSLLGVSALLTLLLITGCSTRNPDTQNNQACTGDACNACAGNRDCKVGTVCTKNKKCEPSPPCNKTSQCNTDKGEICTGSGATNGRCVVPKKCGISAPDTVCSGNTDICHDGICVSESQACAALSCSTNGGGVCTRYQVGKNMDLKCADAQFCQGNSDCLDGKVCSGNQCIEDKCNGNTCPGGGVCDQRTGNCLEQNPCENKGQCKGDSRYCATLPRVDSQGELLKESENRCVDQTNICEEAGCFLGCTCTSQDGNSSVACNGQDISRGIVTVTCTLSRETEVCVDKNSCADGLVCMQKPKGNYACTSATECSLSPDSAESAASGNEDISTASGADSYNGDTGLTLCKEDIDYYKIPTGSLQSAAQKLAIRVEIPRNEVGLGTVVATLYREDGSTEIVTKELPEGKSSVSFDISKNQISNDSFVFMKISQKDSSNISELHYRYYYQIVNAGYCDGGDVSQLTLTPNGQSKRTSVTGQLDSSSSPAPLCASSSNPARNKIYKLVVKEDSTVEISAASSDQNSDLILNVRSDCSQMLTTVKKGCVNTEGISAAPGTPETFKGKLEKGIYYIDLFANNPNTVNYTLDVNVAPLVCTAAYNQCDGSNPHVAHICNEAGDQTLDVTCPGTLACDPNTGNCPVSKGDVCEDAIEVTSGGVLSDYFDTSLYRNDYAIGSISGLQCTSLSGKTSGNDLTLVANVPPDHIFSVNVQAYAQGSPAIYFTKNCAQVDKGNGCLSGSSAENANAQSLSQTYLNTSGETERIYAIIDYAVEATPSLMPNTINYQAYVAKRTCEPNKWECGPSGGGRESSKCNSDGTGYDEFKRCNAGCDTDSSSPTFGQCIMPAYNSCQSPDATNTLVVGTPIEHVELDGLFDSIERPTYTTISNDVEQKLCGQIDPSNKGGVDAYFEIPAKTDAQSYKVTITPEGNFKPMAWISKGGCTVGGDGYIRPECLNGEKAAAAGNAIELYFSAEANTPYGVVVESVDGEKTGEFSIKLENATTATKEKYKIIGCDGGNLKYVDGSQIEQSHHCKNGCDSTYNSCTDGTKDTCPEANLVYPNASSETTGHIADNVSGATRGSAPLSSSTSGHCNFDEVEYPQGRDHFYRFDLKKGDYLGIDFNTATSSWFGTSTSYSLYAFFQKDCGNPDSCLNQYNRPGTNKLSYSASEDETIYLVIKEKGLEPYLGLKYSFDWNVKQANYSCTPGDSVCSSDKNLVMICKDDGLGFLQYACLNECDRGFCRVKEENSSIFNYDRCEGALPTNREDSYTTVTNGGRFLIDRSKLTTTSITSCGYSSGEDAFFKVKLAADDLLHVTLRPLSDTRVGKTPVVWIMSEKSCTSSSSPICEGYTVRDSRKPPNSPLTYDFIPTQGEGNYIVAFDTTTNDITNRGGKYIMDIIVESKAAPTDCVTADTEPKCSNNTHITFCEKMKRVTVECTGQCQSDLLGEPRCVPAEPSNASDPFVVPGLTKTGNETEGNRCVDPVFVNHHDSKKGTFNTKIKKAGTGAPFTNTSSIIIDNMVSDACWFGSPLATSQYERYYAFKLAKGEKLTVTTSFTTNVGNSSHTDVQIYLTQGCLKGSTCLASVPYQLGTNTMSITAPKDDYYYLVFDQDNRIVVPATFKVDWEITSTPPKCEPNGTYCDANKLFACDADGQVRDANGYECEDTCIGTRCSLVANKHDSCEDLNASGSEATIKAPTGHATTSQTYEVLIPSPKLSDNVSREASEFPGTTIEKTNGSDALFKIEINPGGLLTAQLQVSNPKDKAIIYLLEAKKGGECSETSRILSWKTWGDKNVETNKFLEPLTYRNDSTDKVTVILVVDSYGRPDEGDYENIASYPKVLRATVEYPNCSPETFANECSSGIVTYCSADGFKKEYQCKGSDRTSNGSCAGASATSCEHPTGDHCADPYDLTSVDLSTGTHTEDTHTFDQQSNSFDLQPGNSCLGSPQYGRDAVYKIKLKGNHTLTATLLSKENPKKDVSLYLSDTCVTIPQSCVASADLQWATKIGDNKQNAEELTYVNEDSSDKTLYLVVDSTYPGTTGGYTLKLSSAPTSP